MLASPKMTRQAWSKYLGEGPVHCLPVYPRLQLEPVPKQGTGFASGLCFPPQDSIGKV